MGIHSLFVLESQCAVECLAHVQCWTNICGMSCMEVKEIPVELAEPDPVSSRAGRLRLLGMDSCILLGR